VKDWIRVAERAVRESHPRRTQIELPVMLNSASTLMFVALLRAFVAIRRLHDRAGGSSVGFSKAFKRPLSTLIPSGFESTR
jgi:hypothetical protein